MMQLILLMRQVRTYVGVSTAAIMSLVFMFFVVSCGENTSSAKTQDGGKPLKDYLNTQLNSRIGYGQSVRIASEDLEAFQGIILRQGIRSIARRQGDDVSLAIHDDDWKRFLQLLDDDPESFDTFEMVFPEDDGE